MTGGGRRRVALNIAKSLYKKGKRMDKLETIGGRERNLCLHPDSTPAAR